VAGYAHVMQAIYFDNVDVAPLKNNKENEAFLTAVIVLIRRKACTFSTPSY